MVHCSATWVAVIIQQPVKLIHKKGPSSFKRNLLSRYCQAGEFEIDSYGISLVVELPRKIPRIVGNFCWCKIYENVSRLFRKIFLVVFISWNECDALTTPLPVDGHAPNVNRRNNTEQGSKEASLCSKGLVFLLCGGLCNYKSITAAAMGEKLACWNRKIQHCWSWLQQLQSISYGLVGILYSSRVILLYGDYLVGWKRRDSSCSNGY